MARFLVTFRGRIPEFDATASLADNCSDLMSLLGITPGRLRMEATQFSLDGTTYEVDDENEGVALLIAFMEALRTRNGYKTATQTREKLVDAYFGADLDENLMHIRNRLKALEPWNLSVGN